MDRPAGSGGRAVEGFTARRQAARKNNMNVLLVRCLLAAVSRSLLLALAGGNAGHLLAPVNVKT